MEIENQVDFGMELKMENEILKKRLELMDYQHALEIEKIKNEIEFNQLNKRILTRRLEELGLSLREKKEKY